MYPSRFFETSRFHCRTKGPPGANLHLSASHSHARARRPAFSPPPFPHARTARHPSLVQNPAHRPGPALAGILLEIAARVLGAESEEGRGIRRGTLGNVEILLIV